MRRDAARGEGEIGLLGLAIGAAPAIRGLFHPYLVGETSRGITVARTIVCVTRMCVPSSSSSSPSSPSSSLLHPLYSSFSTCEIVYTNAHSRFGVGSVRFRRRVRVCFCAIHSVYTCIRTCEDVRGCTSVWPSRVTTATGACGRDAFNRYLFGGDGPASFHVNVPPYACP